MLFALKLNGIYVPWWQSNDGHDGDGDCDDDDVVNGGDGKKRLHRK